MFWFAADPRLEFDGTSLAHSQHASTRLAALGSALALLAIMAAFAPDPTKAEGAIAIGRVMPKQWVGISINEPTLQAAQDKAISRCNEQGRNCGIATTFRNTCIAIMWVDRIIPAGYTYTIRASLDDARQTAMSNCRAQRAVRCELLFLDATQSMRQRSRPPNDALKSKQRRRPSRRRYGTNKRQETPSND